VQRIELIFGTGKDSPRHTMRIQNESVVFCYGVAEVSVELAKYIKTNMANMCRVSSLEVVAVLPTSSPIGTVPHPMYKKADDVIGTPVVEEEEELADEIAETVTVKSKKSSRRRR